MAPRRPAAAASLAPLRPSLPPASDFRNRRKVPAPGPPVLPPAVRRSISPVVRGRSVRPPASGSGSRPAGLPGRPSGRSDRWRARGPGGRLSPGRSRHCRPGPGPVAAAAGAAAARNSSSVSSQPRPSSRLSQGQKPAADRAGALAAGCAWGAGRAGRAGVAAWGAGWRAERVAGGAAAATVPAAAGATVTFTGSR